MRSNKTWGRDPTVYHPHVHFVVPGGRVNQAEGRWQQTPENFLFPHAAAVQVYKGKFAERLKQAGLHEQVDPAVWKKSFTVDIQPVGDGQAVLKYLAPYVHRVAISDKRVVACDERRVTFRYTPTGKKRSVTRRVDGTEFVRGFVQHVLPAGFQKVRYYGWMSPNSRSSLDEVRWMLWLYLGFIYRQERPRRQPKFVADRHRGTANHLHRGRYARLSMLTSSNQPPNQTLQATSNRMLGSGLANQNS